MPPSICLPFDCRPADAESLAGETSAKILRQGQDLLGAFDDAFGQAESASEIVEVEAIARPATLDSHALRRLRRDRDRASIRQGGM